LKQKKINSMNPSEVYDNPLVTRYASREMAELWGPQRKFSTWRRLWLTLAEAQRELELPADDGVTPRITATSAGCGTT
jgi:adenylosuccinate lyase